eukprot:CAMPEP_0195514824 /NCGR_PEP_ID=MMETSP0794_2-20130614/6096_1 /TAXON_ID=515487 /ORGANISM="Stephanopyxis turris, Strain CCMP 815" /LENGTH=225 /DNA_ID=CAMNT_0040643149 /DNA_START=619 /DNA_END=1296 /DNA_ORIENTATION=-
MRFLVMDAPRQSNLHLYIKEMKRHHVTDTVRVCEPTYQGDSDLRNAGIELHEMAYEDGTSPPKEVISEWLDLVQKRFYSKASVVPSISVSTPPPASTSAHESSSTPSTSAPVLQMLDDKSNVGVSPAAAIHSSLSPGKVGSAAGVSDKTPISNSNEKAIAVHCVAGLGRAPVLVAIALIEFEGFDPVNAVAFIRKHRRGAINEKQLNYLEQYRRQTKNGCACVIM